MERDRANRWRRIGINGLYVLGFLSGISAIGSLYEANKNSDKIVAIIGKSPDEVVQANHQREIDYYLYSNLAVFFAASGVLSAGAAKLIETSKSYPKK